MNSIEIDHNADRDAGQNEEKDTRQNTKPLITGTVLNMSLPVTKSVVESNMADLSKNANQFRNLDSNFLIDNGYIRFSDDRLDCSDVSTFTNSILKSIRTNLFDDPDEKIELTQLQPEELAELTNSNFHSNTRMSTPLIIGLHNNDGVVKITVRPGQHHIVEAMNNTGDSDTLKLYIERLFKLDEYTIHLERGNFIFILPNLMRSMKMEDDMLWFKVVIPGSDSLYNFDSFDWMRKEYLYTPINTIEHKDYPYIDSDLLVDLVSQFKELQERGWGQLMSIDKDCVTFRIRSVSEDDIIKMGEPSIYEAVYEVLYFFDMTNRISHTNYDFRDRFEVRTSGFIARRRNDRFAWDLFDICTNGTNEKSDFVFDSIKVANFLRHLNYESLIRSWYPREEKEEISGLCLNDVRSYSTYVFRYRTLDEKNVSRMAMIEKWINELEIKGGFILSDQDAGRTDPRRFGYLIVSGESIVYGHVGKSGDLSTFLDRYDSFHWKKVTRFDHKNSDYLYEVDYDSYPDSYFIITHDHLKNDRYAGIKDIVDNIK